MLEPAEPDAAEARAQKPIGSYILRGVLFATAALLAVFAFVRIEFQPPAAEPNPAWTPTEAEGMKIVGPADAKELAETKTGRAPETAISRLKRPAQTGMSGTRPTTQAVAQHAQQVGLESASPESSVSANPAPHASPSGTPVETAGDELDAPPPPPGTFASGRRPEEDRPIHKRVIRAVGNFFKGKKPEPKVEPSAHNPQP